MSLGAAQALMWALAVLLGVGLPALAIAMFARALESGGRTSENYRGRSVFLGLGAVWLFWAVGEVAFGIASGFVPWDAGGAPSPALVADVVLLPGMLLAVVAFVFGLLDDALGTGADRGFRGHLSALAHGRLTTGMLKLLGVSAAAFVAAYWAGFNIQPSLAALAETSGVIALLGPALLGGAAIALTSNFVNLTDLRPGRALKVYSLLAIVGSSLVAFAPVLVGPSGSQPSVAERLVAFAILATFVLGPVIAVWRYDLRERGMLGDAGANAAGALAGFLIVVGAQQLWIVGVYALVMLALNLVSERKSFSEIIEVNGALRWLDGLGRLGDREPAAGLWAKTSQQSGPRDR